MSGRKEISVGGHAVHIEETGAGEPVLYLHGFADIHGTMAGWQPFHEALARDYAVIAPAHPACADSDENNDIDIIEDVAFHYLEVMDRLGLDSVNLVGACMGGWIAAELAVRHRERIAKLVLIGASGLFVPDQPIGDLFWEGQPFNGTDASGLRHLLFGDAASPIAVATVPDGRGTIEAELLRYKAYRFASRVGFRPPYFFNPRLRERLGRYDRPALVVWGRDDHLVPPAHGEAYAEGLGDAVLRVVAGAGHSVHIEKPDETAALVGAFLAG